MDNLEPYLDKFSESGKRILESALNETRRRNQNCVSPEHILFALIENEPELFNSEMQSLSADPNTIRLEVEKLLEHSYQYEGRGFRIAPKTTDTFKYSMDRARSRGRRVIDAKDILYALVSDRYSLLNDLLLNTDSSSETVTFYGQVRKIDLDAKQIVLRNISGNELKELVCSYQNYIDKQASEWLNKFVTVTGKVQRDAFKSIYLMRIETVSLTDEAT